MWCRGIRGATTVTANTKRAIVTGTQELLQEMIKVNGVKKDDLACAFLTTTSDLDAEFPAVAARKIGWTDTALLCGHEMNVPGSLKKCVRILLLVNTEKQAKDIVHVYIRGAEVLRPDLSEKSKIEN